MEAHVPLFPCGRWGRYFLRGRVSRGYRKIRPIKHLASLKIFEDLGLLWVLQIKCQIPRRLAPVRIHEVERHLYPPNHQLGRVGPPVPKLDLLGLPVVQLLDMRRLDVERKEEVVPPEHIKIALRLRHAITHLNQPLVEV